MEIIFNYNYIIYLELNDNDFASGHTKPKAPDPF